MKHPLKNTAALVLLGALLVGCAPAEQTRQAEITTVSGINSLIRDNIPPHASQAQVAVFLDEHHIEHTDFHPNNRMISSIVRDTTPSGQVKGSIMINFYFDREAHLKNYSVEEVFSGA